MPPVRRLTAILAADVTGYSRLMGADEEGTHERLRGHLRDLNRAEDRRAPAPDRQESRDGVLAEFASIVDAPSSAPSRCWAVAEARHQGKCQARAERTFCVACRSLDHLVRKPGRGAESFAEARDGG